MSFSVDTQSRQRDALFSCPSQFVCLPLFVYLFTGHEGDRWEIEQRQLHERHQLARTQLKETFFLQRSQMLNRHQKVRSNIWRLLLKKKKPVITYCFDAIVFNIMIRLLGTPSRSLQLWLKSGILLLVTMKFCELYLLIPVSIIASLRWHITSKKATEIMHFDVFGSINMKISSFRFLTFSFTIILWNVLEEFRITFTVNGRRQFLPREKAFP